MAKTRSQTGNAIIKKEKEECKTTLVLNGVSNTTKITTRKPSKGNNRRLPTQPVKVEEDTDTKSLLQSLPKHSKRALAPSITQKQINRIIDAIVNENMSIRKTASTVNVSPSTAYNYYKLYKNDPEKKIPSPRTQFMNPKKNYTQQDIENLIRYVVDDQLSITEASVKANISYDSGRKYYNRYLQDPSHNTPIPYSGRHITDYQKNEFIGYIINDKMAIKAASKKAKMTLSAGYFYCHRYFNGRNPDLTTPSQINITKRYTQKQISKVISYIVNDNMSIRAASRKANINHVSATKHYRRYLKDNNIEIPVSKSRKRYTQDEINRLVGYIVDDKMTIKAATRKANIPYPRGQILYHQYLKDNNLDQRTRPCAQDKINKFIGYIIDDKMSVRTASEKTNMCSITGRKYYRQYLKEHNRDVPIPKRFTQDEINEFIGYVVRDKMSVKAASRKANMASGTGHRYYHQYLNSQKRGVRT